MAMSEMNDRRASITTESPIPIPATLGLRDNHPVIAPSIRSIVLIHPAKGRFNG